LNVHRRSVQTAYLRAHLFGNGKTRGVVCGAVHPVSGTELLCGFTNVVGIYPVLPMGILSDYIVIDAQAITLPTASILGLEFFFILVIRDQ
jgi:hypothetical protein